MNMSNINRDVAKDSAKVLHYLKKQSKERTPVIIKVVVVLGIWFHLSAFLSVLGLASQHPSPLGQIVLGVLVILLSIAGFIAIWNLRKWGVYVLAGLTVLKIGNAAIDGSMNPGALAIFIVLQTIFVVLPIVYWGKMR
jgi:hypothetical protein